MEIKRSESIAALAAALSKAQGEFAAARFDAVNPFLKNRYASLGSIIEAAKPVMAKNSLSVAQPVTCDGTAVSVITLLMHESGEWIESVMSLPLVEERGKSQAQAAGSVITYLRRYALASVLGMYADADTDGSQDEQKKTAKSEPSPKSAPPADPDQIAAELGFAPKAQPAMTLEDAKLEKASDGTVYDTLETPDLAHRLNGIAAGLKKNIEPDYRETLLRKQEAIKLILSSRQ
jgi:hypothetical protein